jgi:hypothetical protein
VISEKNPSKKTKMKGIIVPNEVIENKIYLIREMKVMLDRDLAVLYEVETKKLIQAVKRNRKRFPGNFMIQLNDREMASLRSQIVTSKRGGRRYNAYVFTEQGVAMLSSVLNSERAIQVNIQIMNTFVKLREMVISNRELRRKIEAMEKKYDKRFVAVFDAIRKLLEVHRKEPITIIGFRDRKKK